MWYFCKAKSTTVLRYLGVEVLPGGWFHMQGSHRSSLNNSIDHVSEWLSKESTKKRTRQDKNGQIGWILMIGSRLLCPDRQAALLSTAWPVDNRRQVDSRQVVYCLTSPRLTWQACSRWTQTCHLAICWAWISVKWNSESNPQLTHFSANWYPWHIILRWRFLHWYS